MPDIGRLIAPRSIALVGAGAWTDAVARGNDAIGYRGTVWRVHPTRVSTPDVTYYRTVGDLPGSPDAAFVAVPRDAVPGVASALAAHDAGGFVCFSAGFTETGAGAGQRLTQDLLAAARSVPFFGPNCYGFVNFFDRVALLPDQVVGAKVERGVALICQSGTIALTLMFNARSLPIGYLFTVGNQTCLAVEDLIERLCDDDRVSAFGLYLEGIKDPARFARAAERARQAGKPIAVIKAGRTAAAARTAHSHTGALAGADAVFDAFCRQAGVARCDTLGTLCETLKLLHVQGPLAGNRILVMGASGGDMAMTADVARDLDLDFAGVPDDSRVELAQLLSARVTVANPFDLHTYLWFDPPALQRVFAAVLQAGYDAVGFMLDSPPEAQADTASFDVVIDAFVAAADGVRTRAVLIASLPETLSPRIRARCYQGGVTPLQGLREALEALSLAGAVGAAWHASATVQLNLPRLDEPQAGLIHSLSEHDSKLRLAGFGLNIARGRTVSCEDAAAAAAEIGFPVAIKASGAHLEHKSDIGGVTLNVQNSADAAAAATRLAPLSARLLVEEMCTDGVAEILIGVVRDAQFGQVLVLGAGGVFTELMADSVSLLPPWTRGAVVAALARLKISRLFSGYRGKAAADVEALTDAIMSVAQYAAAHLNTLIELDVNPVIVRPVGRGVLAVDAMIRLTNSDSPAGS